MKTARVLVRSLKSVVCAAALHCTLTLPARAEGPAAAGDLSELNRAAVLNEQGLALYAAQDYRRALESFIGASALEHDPNLLFNIGRCYEQLGELDAALEKYQQFVAAPESDAAGIRRARASIDDIAAARSRQAAAPPSDYPLARAYPVPTVDADPGEGRGAVPWLLVGGAVAFAAAGTTLYALGARDHAKITGLPEYGKADVPADITWRRANALVRSGNTKKVTGGILLGIGGALGVSTVALLLSQQREREPGPNFSVTPAALGGGGALLLVGRFQ